MKSVTSQFLAVALVVTGTVTTSRADFDEAGFESYPEGDLFDSADWKAQGNDGSGKYVAASDRVVIRPEGEHGKVVVWLAGFPTAQQTRLLKSFSPVAGEKVRIGFEFLPGASTLAGRLIFDGGNDDAVISLRFVKGSLMVSLGRTPDLVDTGLKFESQEWNKLQLKCDLGRHEMTISLNGQESAPMALPPEITQFRRVTLFGGGVDFESMMDDLSIQVVDSF